MGVFCDRLKLCSTAAPTARLAKTRPVIVNKSADSYLSHCIYDTSATIVKNGKEKKTTY